MIGEPKGKPLIVRLYANCLEWVFQYPETEEKFSGWTEIVRKDINLLNDLREMVLNRDNDKGKTLAVLYLKHQKPSVRYLAHECSQKSWDWELEDRTNITL